MKEFMYNTFKIFCLKNKRAILVSVLFSLICFGFMLSNFTIGVDEEAFLMGYYPEFWVWQGRFSIWLFDLIFIPKGNYIPFLWDFLSVLVWNLSGIVLAYALLDKWSAKE